MINAAISKKNEEKHRDNIIRINGWEGQTDPTTTEQEVFGNLTIENYIKNKSKESLFDKVKNDKFDEYGFEKEEEIE